MLGKLLKHEFKNTCKLLIPMNLIVLAITAAWTLLLKTGIFDRFNLFSASMVTLYAVSIIALFILTTVYLMMRFYKSMYSCQGYLTHTIPASPSSILNSKILSSMAWIILAFTVCAASILILICSIAGFPDVSMLNTIKSYMTHFFGIPFGAIVCFFIVFLLVYSFSSIMMIFASFSIGQLFHQYRIPAAIGTYVAFYFIQQIISVAGLFLLGISSKMNFSYFYRSVLLLELILGLLYGIVYYIVCLYITKYKLNLE